MVKLYPLIKSPLLSLFKWLKKIIWDPFWWVFLMLIILFLPFLRPWWWVFLPLFLSMELKTLYLWWVAWDFDYPKNRWVFLEMVPPREILAPIRSMEDALSSIFSFASDIANFREIWCEGELDNTPYWVSFEIVSIEGKIHFYTRCTAKHRTSLENSLFSHFPELEIYEVEDYAKNVPHNIPNDEWDLYGEDFILGRPAPYPIKTYESFFEPEAEKILTEEKRIDPINFLLESMTKLGPGENYWLQFIMAGAFEYDEPNFKKEGNKIIARIAKRPSKKPRTFADELLDIANNIIFGPKKEGSGKGATYKWIEASKSESGEREMLLTPGERETINDIEKKMKKPIFRTSIRGLYIAKRNNWKSSNRLIARSYMSHFSSQSSNYLRFGVETRTKVHDIFRKRRVYLRARRLLRNAIFRFPPLFPDRKRECVVLNTEELATLFHFPLRITGMAIAGVSQKIEFKKGSPPPNLPLS